MENYKNLMEIIQKRKSIRGYENKAVEEEKLTYVLEAFRLAPSAKNLQPWKLIVINKKEIIDSLVPACRNQAFISQAPVVIAVCAIEKEAYGMMGGFLNSYPVDIGIAFEHLILAAAEQGLGTCWIGAFTEIEVKKILNVPDEIRVVALTPLGYPSQQGRERTRKEIGEILSYNSY